MELRDLRYLIACVEAGSLSQAALAIHTSQPTLSHALARLESELGERLIDRHPNRRQGVRATAAGALLVERARRALRELEGFAEDLSALRGLLSGELTLGSIQSLNATVLPHPLAAFARAHPGVALRLETLPTPEITRAVIQGTVDLAVVAGAPPSALVGVQSHHLLDEDFVLIVHADDALAQHAELPLSQLRDRPLLSVLPETFTHQVVVEACLQAGFTPTIALALESGEALRETVRAGFGITILPQGYLPADDGELRVIRLTGPTPRREILALTSLGRPPSRCAAAFLAQLHRSCARIA